MKKNLFKRGMAGLLSLVMCLTALVGIGTTTAYAAGERAEVYLVSFPRSGDANIDYSGTWGHPNLRYMNGWHSGASKYTTIRAMHSYDGNICYCIEPGVQQDTGDTYTSKDETFWDNLPSDINSTISPYDMKLFIGRIMQYGYTGPISTSWRSQNPADAATLAEAMATQVLIWETVVGERDEDFDYVSPGSYDAVKGVISTAHPLYDLFCDLRSLPCSARWSTPTAPMRSSIIVLWMRTVVQEINTDYDNKLTEIKSSTEYNDLEMSGSRAVWKEVLAVYAVKINTDPDNPQEVASMDDTKKQLLSDIFWEMNEVSSRTESKTETVIEESDDGNGNIVETETTETKTILYITVSHKTVDEMADQYGFSQEQRDYLAELLKDENNSLWAAALYGIRTGDGEIVTVALSQIGNAGGEPYWSWYGFSSRVEWCACFVSWCANECGSIDAGVIPKFAGCVNGVNWFKERGQWLDGSEEPVPGMIIFFDWDNKGSSGPQDGESDHVGIVERVEDGRVYTVEGNSGDSCRENSYVIGHYEIYGYGVPAY